MSSLLYRFIQQLFCLLFITMLFCIDESRALIGAGAFVPFAGNWQVDKEGNDNATAVNPSLLLHHLFRFGPLGFKPNLGLIIHRNLNEHYNKRTLFFLAHVNYTFKNNIAFNYGLGTFMTSIEGDGKAVVLNNGSGTATFYTPGVKTTSYNTSVDFGLEYFIQKTYSLNFDVFLLGFLSSAKRAFSYAANFNFYLP